jgi:hypothetical protein
LYSKNEFLWKESYSGSYSNIGKSFFEKIDVVIILSGIYNQNRKTVDSIVDNALRYNTPIIIVKPYGLEEIPENLKRIANSIVGWNTNCIIDSIKNSVSGISDNTCDIY